MRSPAPPTLEMAVATEAVHLGRHHDDPREFTVECGKDPGLTVDRAQSKTGGSSRKNGTSLASKCPQKRIQRRAGS